MLVLLGLVPLILVVVALFVHHNALQLKLIPFGLGAIACGFILQLPFVDDAIDQETRVGANISDLHHILLAGVAWWLLGVAALMIIGVRHDGWLLALGPPHELSPAIVAWTVLNAVSGVAAAVVWRLSGASRVEVGDIVQLSDTGSRALLGIYLAWAFVGGLVVSTAVLLVWREPGLPRKSVRLMSLIGACGIGYATHSAVLMAMGEATLQAHYGDVTIVWVLPGLLLLAWIGWEGLRASIRRQRESMQRSVAG